MKKNKLVHIAITSIMLLSTVLTPQMSHAIASMQAEEADESTQVEPSDVDAVNEDAVDDLDAGSNDGDSAEVADVDGEDESGEVEDDPAPAEDDEVADETPEDINNNDPPVEEAEEVETEEVEENEKTKIAEEQAKPLAEEGKDLGNIFEFDYLKLDGEDISDGDIIEIKEETLAELRFAWDTEGMNAKAGDTAKIQLSDAFEIVTTPVQNLIVEGTNVGTYHVENGVLLFKFNDGIETSDVHNGWVNLSLKFDLEKFRENIEQEIPFHDSSDQNITVIAKPNVEHSGIEKEGHPDTEHDAREITWTIDVINTNDEEITNVTLADKIPDGLGEARDFVVHELSVGYDGDLREGANVTSTLNPDEFPIELGTIAPFNGYRVQYKTTIENYAAESFTNNATFSYDDVNLPAETTVDGLTRSNPIEKNGWQVGDNDLIHWQIDVNKNGSLISEAIVDDALPAGLTIDPESIQVVRIRQTGDRWVEGAPHENSFVEFPVKLGTLGQEDAYRIKFETTVDWEDVNEGNYQQNNGFKNETTLYDDEDELNDDDATVPIERDPILRKVGKSNVDYDNKTVTWTIHVNEAGHPIGDVVLTDLIPEGLTITEGDIKITDEAGSDFSPDSINLDPNAEGGTEVVINLGDVGTRQLKVEYTTKITDFTINNFNNGVGMTGVGIGPDGENDNATIRPEGNFYGKSFEGIDYNAKTIDWQLDVNPKREAIDSLTIEDSFPNKGLILLPDTVEVNFAGDKLEEGTDYTLAPRTEDGETGYHKGFTITILDNALPLDGGQLIVDYQTSYDPQKEVNGKTPDPHEPNVGDDDDNIERLYVNSVHYTGETVNENPIDVERNANQRVREDSWNSGKKEGQLISVDSEGNIVQEKDWISGSERKIAWQFYFNYQEQNLGAGVVVTDKLDYAGDIDAASIQVFVYDVESNGETTISDTILDSDNYSVNTDEDGKFILTFKDDFEVTERYVVEFTTSVPDISIENYTNNATVTAGGVDYNYSATVNYKKYKEFLDKSAVNLDGDHVFTGDEVDWQATVNESLSIIKEAVITDTISAGHVYLEDSLEVYKSQDRENALEKGTDYTLEVAAETDEDGEQTGATNLVININGDLQDTLILEYTTVVTETNGQIGNSISLEGTAFDQQIKESAKLNARQFSDVGGEWATNRGALRVTKVDAEENVTIENNEATFTLWYYLNGEMQQFGEQVYTTDGGILEIGNLPLRTYYLREVTAPDGYVKSEEDLKIEVNTAIGNDSDNPIFEEATFENTKEKIDVTGTKEWSGGSQDRPTVWFKLYRQIEDGDVEEVPNVDILELAEGTTEVEWTGLDKTNIDGDPYTFSVKEVNREGEDFIPENYVKEENGLEITNTYVIPTEGVATATKEWIGGSQERPTIWFKLYRQIESGEVEEVPDVEVLELAEGETKVEWAGLAETDIKGNPYIFSVKEVDAEGNDFVPTNYSKSEEGLTITNEYVIPTEGSATATKKWVDGPKEHPTVWFKLFRQIDGGELEEVPEAEVKELADGTTEIGWTGLEETDFDGNDYTFSAKEVDEDGNNFTPENYEKAENGLEITNYYISPTDASAKAIKVWENGPQEHPTVWFKLFRQIEGGELEEVPEAEIKELPNGTTEVIWNSLTKTDEKGNEYIFSVKEVDAEGNDFTPENYTKSENDLIVTNEYIIPVTDVTGTKVWSGGPNEKPVIELQLYRDGKPFGNPVTLENGDTQYTWHDLDLTDINGNLYEYTIDEVEVPENYEKTLSEDGLTITNSHVAPEIPGDPDPKDPEKSDDDSDLPKTGEAASYTLLALALIGLGFGARYYKKRRTN